MAARIPSPEGSVSEDPYLLSKEDFDTLLPVADRMAEIRDETNAEDLRRFKRRYPALLNLSEPYKPELRAGIRLKAAATWKGRSLCHAYKRGRASMLEQVERRFISPKTPPPPTEQPQVTP